MMMDAAARARPRVSFSCAKPAQQPPLHASMLGSMNAAAAVAPRALVAKPAPAR
jgi:hypothetical protein